MYDKTTIFIPVDITEYEVELVSRKLLGSYFPGDMESEALQGWILKLREERKRLCTIVETFVKWISNTILPGAAHRAFMPGHLIALYKQPGVCPVVV